MKVYNVNSIYEQINNFKGVCVPIKDLDNNWIIDQTSLDDEVIKDIHHLIASCPLINYNPILNEFE